MAHDPQFTDRVLDWYQQNGRKNLPWQGTRNPYRIWLSEIMLQQTQVSTVIDYYQRFVDRFPDVLTLADADEDEVLSYWSGLGYYSRARNLHKAAIQLRDRHHGLFPESPEEMIALPGIGRSTAGAILAFAFKQRLPILDGNVKRVLTRFYGIDGWPGQAAIEKQLWQLADLHTPRTDVGEYTQAIMDLGATLCTRRPECGRCPVADYCIANRQGRQTDFPTRKPKKALPVRKTNLLIVRHENTVLLQKRPPTGVWANLWCLPEFDDDANAYARDKLGMEIDASPTLPGFRHTFSHYHLDINPVPAQFISYTGRVMEPNETVWYNPVDKQRLGLPAPVSKLLKELL